MSTPYADQPGTAGAGPAANDPTQASVGELLAEVSRDLSTLMRQEMELAKAELKQSATQAGKGAVIDAHPSCLGAIGVTGTASANAIALNADPVEAKKSRRCSGSSPRTRFDGPG